VPPLSRLYSYKMRFIIYLLLYISFSIILIVFFVNSTITCLRVNTDSVHVKVFRYNLKYLLMFVCFLLLA